MLILFFKRLKRRASKIYHNFKMTHGYIHVIHEGIGSYKKYCAGANNMVIIKKNCVIDNPVFHIIGNKYLIKIKRHV